MRGLVQALSRWIGVGCEAERPSTECLALLQQLKHNDIPDGESAPDGLNEAVGKGLATSGGGWNFSTFLTSRGRHTLKRFAAWGPRPSPDQTPN